MHQRIKNHNVGREHTTNNRHLLSTMRINTPVELQSGRGKIEEILPAHVSKDAAVLNPTEKHDDTTMLVDFTHPELCAQTRPVSCLIEGRVVIPARRNWSSLLVAITELLIENEYPNLSALENKPLYGNRIFFMPRRTNQGNCFKLSNGKWIYTNYNPQTIVTIIASLCRHCKVSLNVTIQQPK